jgi:hypothetical protein
MTEPVANRAVIEWADLKAAFLDFYNGGTPTKGLPMHHAEYRRGARKSEWNGASADEMAGWLQNGFTSPEFPVTSEYVPSRPSRRMVFSEDGELDLTLAWSGHDYPYLEWEQQRQKPGIKVVAEFGFSAACDHREIAKYGAWVLGILEGLETMGYDIELDLTFTTGNQNASVPSRNENFQTIVRVKRENELTDLSDFSALFSPGGYRILMFIAASLAADKIGARLTSSLGCCNIRKDDVSYDPETGILRIDKNQREDDFDQEGMTAAIMDIVTGQ